MLIIYEYILWFIGIFFATASIGTIVILCEPDDRVHPEEMVHDTISIQI
jgi:hypothetical protein